MAKSSATSQKKGAGLWDTIKTIVYAVLIALVIRTFLYEPFSIPSGSMFPTLYVGDYIFVSKFSYGYGRYSFPFGIASFKDRVLEGEPDRGDVIVFRAPNSDKDFIKRLVGLPGDTLQVRAGILHINGCPVRRERVGDWTLEMNREATGPTVGGGLRARNLYRETFPTNARGEACAYDGGDQHMILERSDQAGNDNTELFRVSPGHYFMMGDNRDNSEDSRFIGAIPAERLIGRAEIVFFSSDYSARLWEFWGWPTAIRYRRLLKGLD